MHVSKTIRGPGHSDGHHQRSSRNRREGRPQVSAENEVASKGTGERTAEQ